MVFDRPAVADPFTEAFVSVVNAIENSPSVTSIVIADNIVADVDIQPQLDYRQAGDLPALLIMQDSSDGDNLWSSNTTADFEMRIVFRLLTGDERIGKYLNPMKWAITRALFSKGVVLNDLNVVEWNLTTFAITNTPDETYGISERGWIAEMTMNLNLCIDHTDITE